MLEIIHRIGVAAAIVLGLELASAQTRVVYETESDYNKIVVTENSAGIRSLMFERHGALQSVVKPGDPDHIELPYVRAMMAGLAYVEDPERILIVGLGGGSIPMFLHRHYPDATIDVVDIDPEVVRVARQYFAFTTDRRLRAYTQDGRRFIEEAGPVYDLILLDAYGSRSIPRHLATREFLLATRRALTRRGLVVGNVWSRASNPLYDSMVRTYRDVFERLYLLEVSGVGNIIFLALPRQEAPARGDLVSRAEELSQERGFPFALGEVIRYGLRLSDSEGDGASILLDEPGR